MDTRCDMTKPTEWLCAQQRLISLIRVIAVRMKKAWVLSYPLSAKRRLWSDWADSQADLSLRWAHTQFVGFGVSWLIFFHPGFPWQRSRNFSSPSWPWELVIGCDHHDREDYCKFPKYSDTQNICCNHSKIWTMWLYHRVISPNDADGMANSVGPDQEQCDLGLHCLPRHICPKTWDHYGSYWLWPD